MSSTDGDRLKINPDPLAVVPDRGSVSATARMALSFTREQRKMAWVACGNDPQVWEDEHPAQDRMADLIRESVAEMSASVVEWEIRTRYPAEWVAPESDGDRREMLVEILIAEREKGLGNECRNG
jgi:hypothetical protein